MPALDLFRSASYLKTTRAIVTATTPEGIRLNQTIFYPLGGGQPGDTGHMSWNGGEATVIDTRKYRAENEPDDVLHVLAEGASMPPVGAEVTISIDWDKRYAYMRMHTCMHLLSALLRDCGITGCQVGAEKGRVDFSMPNGVPEKEWLTTELNRVITESHAVTTQWISDADLEAQPDLVRSMSVRPPMGTGRVRLVKIGDVDLQPCGGTHVANTSEIGPVEVSKIENKGKMNRRIHLVFVQNVAAQAA